ncbi:site-specific integrase, partial [Vibrio cortegadensis]
MKSLLFSSKVVQSLNAKARTYTVWDTKNPALGVRVYADGRRFYVTYLPIPNKTLAAVGQFTLKQAREHVQALQSSFLEKEAKPIRLIRFDALVKEEWTETVLKEWKPSTQAGALSALRKHLLPEFGRYPVGRIDSFRVH